MNNSRLIGNPDMLEYLLQRNLILPSGKLNPHITKLLTNEDIDQINGHIKFDCSLKEKLILIKQGKLEPDRCKTCGKYLKIQTTPISFCNSKCSLNDPLISEKRKATKMQRYGDPYGFNNQTNEKRRVTNLERYGVEYPLQHKDIKQKASPGFADPQIQQKAKQVINDKYGGCAANLPIHKANKKQRYNDLYGVDDYNQITIRESIPKLQSVEWLIEQHHNNKYSLQHIAEILGVNQSTVQNYIHKHDIEIKRYKITSGHLQLMEFLDQLGIQYRFNVRNLIALELDIVCDSHKLAIEYNGTYWHSEQHGKGKYYHLNKTNMCKDIGYTLIHIFDDEWKNDKEIVKSRLRAKLNRLDTKIYARQCQIQKVPKQQSKLFMDSNHIQHSVSSSIQYGLYYNDELVACMTFGVSRYNKSVQWELLRFANKLNTVVVGAGSRLLKHFIKNHGSSIISYSDKRWNTGNGYLQMGFVFVKSTEPNFYITKQGKRYSRISFQNHRLPTKLKDYDDTLTPQQNLILHGYHKLWGCGQDVFILK